jgi:alpha-glucosidase
MRWDASPSGGFTSGEPWLPMGPDIATRNVALLKANDKSLIALYRSLTALRRSEPLLETGAQVPLRSRNDVLAFKRTNGAEHLLIALNMTAEPRRFSFEGAAELLLSTCLDGAGARVSDTMLLRSNEGVILKIGEP